MVGIGVIASALGIALGLAIDWFPSEASTQAHKIDTLWDVLLICSVPVFVLVTVVVLTSVIEFRVRRGEEELDGPPIHGNTRLEVVWTAVPALLLVSLCTYAYVVLTDIEQAPASAKERHVTVVGEQFTWTFEYPGAGAGGKALKTSQLYLPVGQSVKFDVRSKDVIHDFWVPEFRMKIDAVPGITTSYRITPTKPGNYPVVCAELCGLGHAFMRQTAHVLPRDRFDAWLAKATKPAQAAAPGGGGAAKPDGKAIFTRGNAAGATACASCHQLADAGSPKGVGPTLDQAVPTLGGPAGIRKAIVDPGADVAKGFPAGVMPTNYGDVLSPEELDALTTYLVDSTKK
jgi:cytochrome c oxidase subunit 2